MSSIFALLLAIGAQAPTIEVNLWAEPGAEKDPRVVSIFDHGPCGGKVARVRITVMPPYSTTAALQPDLAAELSTTAAVIRRWSLPAEYPILAVAGERVVVPLPAAGHNRVLSISPSGEIQVVAAPRNTRPEQQFECPAIPDFQGSAYVRCFEFTDIISGQPRRIAYQMPCT